VTVLGMFEIKELKKKSCTIVTSGTFEYSRLSTELPGKQRTLDGDLKVVLLLLSKLGPG